MEGRVEMCRGGVWGAVYGWDFNGAQITCQQLGYPSNCELAIFMEFRLRTSTLVSVVYHMELNRCSNTDAMTCMQPPANFGSIEGYCLRLLS